MAAAVGEPVDVLLDLAAISADEPAAVTALVRDSVVVNTVPETPAPDDEAPGVRAVAVFVRTDVAQLAELVGRVERGARVARDGI